MVKLTWVTPDAEKLIVFCARVSNPENQNNPEIKKLIKYCITNAHWSIFEMANMCVEIHTTRAISAQIIRHRSFSFQEQSSRYAVIAKSDLIKARKQHKNNRQSSTDDLDSEIQAEWLNRQSYLDRLIYENYEWAINNNIARESARMLLPMKSPTVVYMNGTVRSWIHYIELRTAEDAQYEHRIIAAKIKDIFKEQFPIISEALGW